MTGAAYGAGNALPSGTHDFFSDFAPGMVGRWFESPVAGQVKD